MMDIVEMLRNCGDSISNEAANVIEALRTKNKALHAALSMIAQTRHVSGSAQGAFRSNLRIADAALAGVNLSDDETAIALFEREDPHNVTEQAFCQWCQKSPCECGKEAFGNRP
jgi:hypothetical protein